MSDYRFDIDDAIALPTAWRPIDRAVHRWVLAHGGSDLLARTAGWASAAHGDGHTALPLRDAHAIDPGMTAWNADEIAALRVEAMVATGDDGDVRPFVLDADDRFYLWRNRRDESRAIDALRERREAVQPGAIDAAFLDALFAGDDDATVARQRAAVRQVVGKRLFVLTGGPGTGKSTTVLRMLLMLQRCAGKPLTIAAAAPTGKAAQRLTQAMRTGVADLREHARIASSPEWRATLDCVPASAVTLHRLLGMTGDAGRFRHDAAHRLDADVVVVDEASMLDLSLLCALLAALRNDAIVIFVGDADQLASVGAGAVLTDLVAVLESDVRGDLVRLHHVFRAQQPLAAIHECVRGGDAAAFAAALGTAGDVVAHYRIADVPSLAAPVQAWCDWLAIAGPPPRLSGDPAGDAGVARGALQELSRRQLLCALREGPFGALAVAARIERHLRRRWGQDDDTPWYHGRPILVTRNDYRNALFNGDVGLCLQDPNGTRRVWFESSDAGGVRAVTIEQLPPHDSALAITVHKSQGSEYEHVAVLLPPAAEHAILSRALLYTALSRAKKSVELWCNDDALAAALAGSVERTGGLAARLRAR